MPAPRLTTPELTVTQLWRIEEKIRRYDDTPCWEWAGGTASGYPIIKINGTQYQAHRVTYELLQGFIPPGKVLHHVCRTKTCVNPQCLVPMDIIEHAGLHNQTLS